MEKTLKEGLTRLGLDLPEERQEKLCAFARAMVKQNEVMNLTAITEDTQVAKLHLLDSLTVLCCADLRGKKLIDVGCGAGFPGVPLAIACPEAIENSNAIGSRNEHTVAETFRGASAKFLCRNIGMEHRHP